MGANVADETAAKISAAWVSCGRVARPYVRGKQRHTQEGARPRRRSSRYLRKHAAQVGVRPMVRSVFEQAVCHPNQRGYELHPKESVQVSPLMGLRSRPSLSNVHAHSRQRCVSSRSTHYHVTGPRARCATRSGVPGSRPARVIPSVSEESRCGIQAGLLQRDPSASPRDDNPGTKVGHTRLFLGWVSKSAELSPVRCARTRQPSSHAWSAETAALER